MHTAIITLANHTALALNHTANAISLVSKEIPQIRKGVMQNCMSLELLTAAQEETCAILRTEHCVYIR